MPTMYAACLWRLAWLLAVGVCAGGAAAGASAEEGDDSGNLQPERVAPPRLHGVDDSWPVQSLEAFRTHATPDRQQAYDAFLTGCGAAYGADVCAQSETARIAVNAMQPALLRNLTATGYARVRMPPPVFTLLREHLFQYQENLVPESWGSAQPATFVNHWEEETDTHNLAHYMALADRQRMQRQVQDVLEDWCGAALTPVAVYGMRIYRRGAVVAPHVDRLPLVVSAILHVARDDNDDNNDDWPLQVIGRDGVAVNVTLQPGEMFLYESASILHGRPYPLQGWYYANVFLQFEPIGYSYEWKQRMRHDVRAAQASRSDWARTAFHEALATSPLARRAPATLASSSSSSNIPPYVIPDTQQELRWKQEFIFHREPKTAKMKKKTPGATTAHTVAANGDLESLIQEASKDPSILDMPDANGWKPIHEAARGGQTQVLEYLVAQGVNVNERTHQGLGASPLWWAQRNFADNHPAIQFLQKQGAVALPPIPKEERA